MVENLWNNPELSGRNLATFFRKSKWRKKFDDMCFDTEHACVSLLSTLTPLASYAAVSASDDTKENWKSCRVCGRTSPTSLVSSLQVMPPLVYDGVMERLILQDRVRRSSFRDRRTLYGFVRWCRSLTCRPTAVCDDGPLTAAAAAAALLTLAIITHAELHVVLCNSVKRGSEPDLAEKWVSPFEVDYKRIRMSPLS